MQRSARVHVFCRQASLGSLLGLAILFPKFTTAQETSDQNQLRMLGQCSGCSLEGLDLSGRRMTGVDLSEATLRNVDFSGTRLNIAVFNNAVLENVAFVSADLRGATFVGARMINVSFEGADLRGAVFESAVLESTDLQAGQLCNTQMTDDTMENSNCD